MDSRYNDIKKEAIAKRLTDPQRSLCIDPSAKNFSAREEGEVARFLDLIDKSTVSAPISDLGDIWLADDAKTRKNGLRFTSLAMLQYCNILCPGLSKVVFTVSGKHGSTHKYKVDDQSLSMAVAIVNSLAKLRFDKIKGKYLVRNTKLGSVDGVIGSSYFLLPNLNFFEIVSSTLREYHNDQVFGGAVVSGRKLSLIYHEQRPFLSIPTDMGNDNFHFGFSFINSETGDSAVRLAPIIVLRTADSDMRFCLSVKKRFRLVHMGKALDKKLATCLNQLLTNRDRFYVDRDKTSKLIEDLVEIPLGFGSLTESEHTKRMSKFVSNLRFADLTKSFAQRVMNVSVYKSRRDAMSSNGMVHLRLNNWSNRTRYDLLVALLTESSMAYPKIQDIAEIVGYQLIHDQLDLPE